MFGYLDGLLSDPIGTLVFFLTAFPGRLLAISAHEYAHARVAYACGDDTAKQLGRMTLNPLKHLDLIGALMMLLLGFGWAKPVPINPRRYRNYRRDDLLVSLAGIGMNLILAVVGMILMYVILALGLSRLEMVSVAQTAFDADGPFLVEMRDGLGFFPNDGGGYYYAVSDLVRNGLYLGDSVIAPIFGSVQGILYNMLMYFVLTNLSLAVFNLIPVPPLDGYHVLNDTILKKPLFSSYQAGRIGMTVLMALSFTGILGDGISFVIEFVTGGMGSAAQTLFAAMGMG